MAQYMMDITLSDTEDLKTDRGDFEMSESTGQHQTQLLLNNKGDFKQFPTIGVGCLTYLHDEQFQNLIRAIGIEFSRDGMTVTSVRMHENGVLESVAAY